MTRDPERVSDLTEKSGGLKNSLDADQLPSSSEDGAVHKECVSSDPGVAVPAPGSPILRLNRDMRCKTQCREKIAACEPERGTRNPGEPTHLEPREGFEGDFCMSYVLVINQQKQPCQPVHPAQARRLLSAGKAVVYRRFSLPPLVKGVFNPPPHPARPPQNDPGPQTQPSEHLPAAKHTRDTGAARVPPPAG